MMESFRGRMPLVGSLLVLGLGVILGLILAAPADLLGPLQAERGDGKVKLAVERGVTPLGSPFKGIAAKAAPAVVFVEVKRETEAGSLRQFRTGTPFDEMFRRMFPEQQQPSEPMVVPSWGSGFFIDKQGYILTNNHVVRDAQNVRVQVTNDRFYDAEVVAEDPDTDVAVLRIPGDHEFPVLPLGDSDELEVGDWAIAVGNPFGTLHGSLTVGVVSAKGRSDLRIMGGAPNYQDFIQTDASINYGNSGGPLLNIRGEVIGINTAINPSGQGIGFAIPINLARDVAEKLINEGQVVRGYIGIVPQELTADLAEGLGLTPHQGILVGKVVEDGPAASAGLRSGDLIVKFAGESVSDVPKFRFLVASQPLNKKVRVTYLRKGEERDAEVAIRQRPTQLASAEGAPRQEVWLGIEAQEVSPQDAGRMGLETQQAVVVVSAVVPGSSAEDAGIQPGDIIRELNGQPVKNLADYSRLVGEAKKAEKKPIVFLLERDGVTQYFAVRPHEEIKK